MDEQNSYPIKTENLTRRLSGEITVTLVQDVSIKIRQGESATITGPSGSGKSSLLYLLGLLDTPSAGKLWINNVEVSTYTQQQLADLRLAQIGFVFQFHFLLPEFTALENVMLPMQKLGRIAEPEMKKRAEELLTSLGLGEKIHKLPKQLSGGQSQRVAIARALANDPQIIFADEPTGNLDTASSANVQSILLNLARNNNRTVVVVTHDMEFAGKADRIIRIVDGKVDEN